MPVDVNSGVLLRLAFRTDMRARYRAATDVVQEVVDKGHPVARNEQHLESIMTQWVIRSDEPSSAHILTIVEPVGEFDPSKLPPGVDVARQAVYSQMSDRGEILEVSGQDSGNTYSFPPGAVKMGDSWEVETSVRFPGMLAPAKGKNTFVVLGSTEVDDIECVKIEMRSSELNFEMPLPDGQAAKVQVQTKGILYFSPERGILMRLELQTRSAPKIGDVTFDTTTKMEQQLTSLEIPEA